jgi:asparagine synthase (glutamine-hydrolysing)
LCGFAGFVGPRLGALNIAEELREMGEGVNHRGPDDSGLLIVPEVNLGIIHKRLSILDLSPEGRQPMESSCGRFVVAYNGEIYNFRDLRKELQGRNHKFVSHTDTEVLLCAIQEWGLVSTLSKLIGMFALALLDKKFGRLHLVRDRMGEKPLYYGWQGKTFLFGSELKALQRNSCWLGKVDEVALSEMLHLSYVPAPKTIYRKIFKVEPGQIVTLNLDQPSPEQIKKERWWSYEECLLKYAGEYAAFDEHEVLDLWESQFKTVIQDSSISDVALGAFLSGGIDSSLITAFLQEITSQPVKTFSIGFSQGDYDESRYAQQVASFLGTDHSSLMVSEKDVSEILPEMPHIYDEPFADSSQILTSLLSRHARQDVTVALSGDGGDEMFGGYNRYKWASAISKVAATTPRTMLKAGSSVCLLIEKTLRKLHSCSSLDILPVNLNTAQAARRFRKLSEALHVTTGDDVYRVLTRESLAAELLQSNTRLDLGEEMDRLSESWNLGSTAASRFNFSDIVGYLPDDILAKVDRASMAFGLEVRAPLLDYRVVQFSAKLAWNQKISRGETKSVLRRSLAKRLPAQLFKRPKQGFSLPIGQWLRGPLRHWSEDLISEAALRDAGFVAPAVRNLWNEHLTGRQDHTTLLWNVMMYQAWFEKYQRA